MPSYIHADMSEFHDPGSGPGQALGRRAAILEQIAAVTQRTLAERRTEIRGLRTDLLGEIGI